MSRKHFSLLLVLTLAVALLVLLVPGKTGKESEFEPTRLLPGLQQQVNDLDWLQFSGAGGATIATLQRGGDAWRVAEAEDYPADWERLRTLLADLTRAEIVEAKTANPDYYDRLGVEDIDQPDAGGTRIAFPEGSDLPAVIVGKRAQGRDGQYVRLQGVAESALIDRELDLPGAAEDWLDRDIVDIPDSEVVEVEIVRPGGERIVAKKASADDADFVLQEIPEGREIRSAWAVNSLANALSALTLDAVARDDSIDWSEAATFGLITADGLRVEVELVSRAAWADAGEAAESEEAAADEEPEHWIRLQAGLYQTAIGSAVATPEDTAEGAGSSATGELPADRDPAPQAAAGEVTGEAVSVDGEPEAESAGDDAEARARAINERVAGWAYRIPPYKFDAMNKRMEDLLKAVDEGEN